MYKSFLPNRLVVLTLAIILLSSFPAFSGDFGLEAGFGAGIWGGPWSRDVLSSQDTLGLGSRRLLIPAGSSAVVWKGPELFGPFRLEVAAGLGLWSGSWGGYESGDLEQAHSILALALEARPRLTAEFPLKRGALVVDANLGTGFVLGPLLSIDTLPGVRSVSKASPEFLNRLMGIAGLGIGYRFTRFFVLSLRLDGGIADFDPAPGSDPSLMGRLLVCAEYLFPKKETL